MSTNCKTMVLENSLYPCWQCLYKARGGRWHKQHQPQNKTKTVVFRHSKKDAHINSTVTCCRRPLKLLPDNTVIKRGDHEHKISSQAEDLLAFEYTQRRRISFP